MDFKEGKWGKKGEVLHCKYLSRKGETMLVIRKKDHMKQFLESFVAIAEFDAAKEKHYFVFDDKDRGGHITLMNTKGIWSIHGKGDTYCDDDETYLEREIVFGVVWKHRAAINRALKEKETVEV